MRKSYLILLSILLSVTIFNSCDDTVTGNDIDNRLIPDKDVSFQTHLLPVFNAKCSTSGCHDNVSMAGGYSMVSWSSVVEPGIVNPFSAETSIIIWRIDPRYGFDPMPPLGQPVTPMTEDQIQGVVTWINEGAKNN
ncbi:MAG: hypothetical protein JW995_07660 [Melioribacteraceae bacterium]|nr:hypothetical protein [Melioribacteraceae bacterium]